MKVIRNKLCNSVNRSIRHTHRSANITYRRPCLKCSEGYNLRNMVCTVFLSYIIYNLLPAFIAEIYIKIRHRHSFRI